MKNIYEIISPVYFIEMLIFSISLFECDSILFYILKSLPRDVLFNKFVGKNYDLNVLQNS